MPHTPGHDGLYDSSLKRPEDQILGGSLSVPPSPSVSTILGWSWLGRWDGEGEDPHIAPIVKAFIDKWEAKFRELAEGGIGLSQDALIREFEDDLYKQGWWQDKNNAWQSITKMRYGTDTPLGEWDNLIETTKEYVDEYLRDLGFADWQGNLTVEYDEQFIEDLIYDTAKVGPYGLPLLDPNLANAYIEEEWIPSRGFATEEGEFRIGEGSLRDLYKELKRLADNNYVSIPDEELWDMVSRIKREDMNMQGAYNIISNRVADQFDFLHNSPIMERINSFNTATRSGLGSLKSHLSPVITSVANAWELDDDEINLQNMFGQGLESLITGDGDDRRFMNSREARDWARLQPEYKQTQDYGMRMGNITQELLRTFGAI
tara:strand:- start:227 stop:1351 length:1125 start_codon:yes stop_codon:yes gene_type:complete